MQKSPNASKAELSLNDLKSLWEAATKPTGNEQSINPEGQILLPVKFLEEYIQLLEESNWSPLYKLVVLGESKALLESVKPVDNHG